MTYKTAIHTILLLSVLTFISGCASHPRSVSEKRTFLLQVTRPEGLSQTHSDNCLRVRLCRTAGAFSGSQFVYRTGPYRYEQDYYNGFFTSPDDQITGIISRWFRDSGMFACLQDSETITLEPNLEILCVDFQNREKPYVFVKMSFHAGRTDESCNCPIDLLQKEYSAKIPLNPTPSPDDIIQGMSSALGQILTQLENDLAVM